MQLISTESTFSKPIFFTTSPSNDKYIEVKPGMKLYAQFNGEGGNYAMQIEDNGKSIDVIEVSYEIRHIATKWLLFKKVPMLIRNSTLLDGTKKVDRLSTAGDIVYDMNTKLHILVVTSKALMDSTADQRQNCLNHPTLGNLLLAKGTGMYKSFNENEVFTLRKFTFFVKLFASKRKIKTITFDGNDYFYKLPNYSNNTTRTYDPTYGRVYNQNAPTSSSGKQVSENKFSGRTRFEDFMVEIYKPDYQSGMAEQFARDDSKRKEYEESHRRIFGRELTLHESKLLYSGHDPYAAIGKTLDHQFPKPPPIDHSFLKNIEDSLSRSREELAESNKRFQEIQDSISKLKY